MKVYRFVLCVVLLAVAAFGCSQKKEVVSVSGLGVEEDKDMVTQTISSPEAIESQPAVQAPPPLAAPIQIEAEQGQAIPMEAEGLERNKQIQVALKDANLYFGEMDGKIGPLTRKAIEEFQKMKGLKVDGKVGPITWGELQKYLNFQPAVAETKKKR